MTRGTPRQLSEATLVWGTKRAWITLTATILASGVGFLDGSVVSVALPRIDQELGGGLATLQWVMDGYLLTLGSLVLVGGSLGDLLGKRRIFIFGTAAFGATSVLCGLAPTSEVLIGARMLQGAAAALMVPTSLALLNSLFVGVDRGKAIGLWSGLAGVFTAVGPFVGGLLVDTGPGGWRWVFILNIPLVIGAVILARIAIPNLAGTRTSAPIWSQVDVLGGVLAVIGLGLIMGPLIEVAALPPAVMGACVLLGILILGWLVVIERERERTLKPPPMIPLSLFSIRTFTVANFVTLIVYGALGVSFFLVTIALQQGLGYSASAAGIAGIPVTIVIAAFSSRVGGMLPKVGARTLLTTGPLVMAVGMILLGIIRPGQSYWVSVFPGFLVFGIGLVLVVAPVTATALTEVRADASGTASGINNAVARIGSLVAIILVPLASGLATSQAGSLATGTAMLDGYRNAMFIAAGVCLVGGLIALFGFRSSDGKMMAAQAT